MMFSKYQEAQAATLFAALLILASQNGRSATEPSSALVATATEQSNTALAEVAKDFPGISATVFLGSKQVWSSNHGYAGLAEKTRVTGETRFNIYSTSKALTGFAFARLVEEGTLELDQTVKNLAPELPAHFHAIRIRDILSHTSGIRHYRSPQDWLAFAQLDTETPTTAIEYFKDDELVHQPGSKTTYSTFAFVLASELLVRITGEENFADALNRTLGPWADFQLDQINAEKARMYIQAGRLPQAPKGISPEDIVPLPPLSAESKFGGGGIIASSSELARAGAALCNGEILPSDKLIEALRPQHDFTDVVYGGAMAQHDTSNGPYHSYSLSGGAPGGRSYLLALIEPQISVAIAGNIEGPNLSEVVWKIAKSWMESSD